MQGKSKVKLVFHIRCENGCKQADLIYAKCIFLVDFLLNVQILWTNLLVVCEWCVQFKQVGQC